VAVALSVILSVRGWLAGGLGPTAVILLIMLPLFVNKINMTLFIELTAYRNLLISKDKITGILSE